MTEDAQPPKPEPAVPTPTNANARVWRAVADRYGMTGPLLCPCVLCGNHLPIPVGMHIKCGVDCRLECVAERSQCGMVMSDSVGADCPLLRGSGLAGVQAAHPVTACPGGAL